VEYSGTDQQYPANQQTNLLSLVQGTWRNGSHPRQEAQMVIEQWRLHYKQIRPHCKLGYKPPTPAAKFHSVHNFSFLEEHNNWFLDWGQVHFEMNKLICFLKNN